MMQRYGLVGGSLGHSHSPALHKKIMELDGISGTYDLIEIAQENFPHTLPQLFQGQYDGLNVTTPYKEQVVPYLDSISPLAKYIGAVNTISFSDGKAIGHNTDYVGFQSMMELAGISAKGKNAIVLGTGGAAKAVIKALLDMGVCDLTVVSRGKLQFHNQYTVSYEFFRENKVNADLIVNCTPIGMAPLPNHSPIPKASIHADLAVDLIYNPEETLFLRHARELGIKTMNGKVMLQEQAKASHQIWRGEEPK